MQKGLILAQDAVYDQHGEPDWARTPFYVPNDYLFEIVARYPQWMLPCVSINPDRKDALAELERCVAKGARALKIHPPIQGVDLADKKHTRFFQRCAALKTVVLVHTGHEHSSPIIDVGLANPRKLELALDQGCTVVACHCGTGRQGDRPDMLPDFLAMMRQYTNLWGDTSVLGGFGRSRDFLRLLDDKPACERLLHGSDFPFPAIPMAFSRQDRRRGGSPSAGAIEPDSAGLCVEGSVGHRPSQRGTGGADVDAEDRGRSAMMARRCHAVVNPRGGKHRGIAILEQVRPVFDEAGWELAVSVTEYPGTRENSLARCRWTATTGCACSAGMEPFTKSSTV